MSQTQKGIVSFLIILCLTAGSSCAVYANDFLPAYISSFLDKFTYTQPEKTDESDESDADTDTEEEYVYRNPLMSYEPYVYIKGGVTYYDFYGLPDYGQYARLDGTRIAVYPTQESTFFFVGLPDTTYTYRDKIIDYFDSDASTLKAYKAYIKTLGFTNKKSFESADYAEYIEKIRWQLKYDPDFTVDKDGIFMVDYDETFLWLLIGKSIEYDSAGTLRECTEFRFYSLSRTPNPPVNILDGVGDTPNYANPDGQSTNLFTPNPANDIIDVSATPPSQQGYPASNAVNDIIDVSAPSQQGYGTPSSVIDIIDVSAYSS
ncbi:MAG: hypothetical protein LBS21_08910 [Clostridiales bacterium]|jgi:hypothetical protein|nr:hypothetical protein [Clostridiales bacterium]